MFIQLQIHIVLNISLKHKLLISNVKSTYADVRFRNVCLEVDVYLWGCGGHFGQHILQDICSQWPKIKKESLHH